MIESEWYENEILAGGYINNVLYRMAADKGTHDNVDHVFAKALIIGRVYSASVTRGAGELQKIEQQDEDRGLYRHIAQSIVKESKFVDEKISEIKDLGIISEINLQKIVKLHCDFDQIIIKSIKIWRDIHSPKFSRNIHSRSSFCSKYLHFHAPMQFFIMDSIAQRQLKEIMIGKNGRWPNTVWPEGWQAETETDYARFSLRMLDHAKRHYPDGWNPRLIDGHLLGYIKPSEQLALPRSLP